MDRLSNLDKCEEPDVVYEYLTTTPYLRPDRSSPSVGVEFGNSGLRIFFLPSLKQRKQPYASMFDFTPDGYISRQTTFAAKHATVLGSALYQVHELLNSPQEMSKLKLDKNKVLETSNLTNLTLVKAISSLFSDHGHKDIVTAAPSTINEHGRITINLKKFGELNNTDTLIQYLQKLSKRAEPHVMRELEELATFRKNAERR